MKKHYSEDICRLPPGTQLSEATISTQGKAGSKARNPKSAYKKAKERHQAPSCAHVMRPREEELGKILPGNAATRFHFVANRGRQPRTASTDV